MILGGLDSFYGNLYRVASGCAVPGKIQFCAGFTVSEASCTMLDDVTK